MMPQELFVEKRCLEELAHVSGFPQLVHVLLLEMQLWELEMEYLPLSPLDRAAIKT